MRRTVLGPATVVMVIVCSCAGGGSVSIGAAEPVRFEVTAAVGVPLEDHPGNIVDAGAVYVFPQASAAGDLGTHDVLTINRATLGGTLAAGDHFGAAVVLTDKLGPGAQLIIGAPGAESFAGRVYIVRSDPSTGRFDLEQPTVLRQGRHGLPGTAEPGDGFGATLQVVDAGGRDPWLAVGAPGEDVQDVADAGAVTGIPLGTDTARAKVFYQGGLLPGVAEGGDWFGTALAQFGTGVIASAMSEDVGPIVNAGGLTAFDMYGRTPPRAYRQGRGLPGPPEAGDQLGRWMTGLDEDGVLIGVPREDIGGVRDAGIVIELPGAGSDSTRPSLWYQGHRGIQGVPEEGDGFGSELAHGSRGLLIGVPNEVVGDRSLSGAVHFLPLVSGSNRPFSVHRGRQMLHAGMEVIPGSLGMSFGQSVGWSGDRLLIGVDQDVGAARFAGAVVEMSLDDDGHVQVPPPTLLTEASFGSRPEYTDYFGSVLTTR
jgi:hypothetical protein